MIQNEFTYLSQAFNEESWEWLQDANIKLARALHAEVNRGATADDLDLLKDPTS